MQDTLTARVQQQAWFHKYPRGLPFALLGIGLLATLLLIVSFERTARGEREMALAADTTALAGELQRRADENVAYVVATASLFEASPQVSDEKFGKFIVDMSGGSDKRGAVGIGWAIWSKPGQHAATAAELRRIHPDRTDLDFDTNGTAPKAIVGMLQPATEQNRKAIGFDMYSEAVRRDAIDRAIRDGKPALTGLVHLVQDRQDQSIPAALLYVPVLASSSGNNSADIRGLAYSPIRIGEFLQNATSNTGRNFSRIELYDEQANSDRLLFALGGEPPDAARATRTIDFAGRKWIVVASAPAANRLTQTSLIVAVLGTMLSLLLMATAWYMTARAADDQQVLERLTEEAEIRASLTRELNHRVKNTLANVLSIVSLTHRRATDLDSFVEGLTGRLRALSATHDLLSQRDWKDAPVSDVVQSELAPFLDHGDGKASFSGPDILLGPNDALSLGLALHELATNASKYGALSVPDGHVSVSWKPVSDDLCEVVWVERGGPTVTAPRRRGFGTELIEKIVSQQLRQAVTLTFDPDGVTCRIPVPVRAAKDFELRSAGA